ncbi:MAG: nucleotide exchange factor GrpE, partial [Candidatus Aminicenantes bacterium]|nr:nucleotide exchange factor GrpE [Candidatus Aminicenantes bacterium]
MSRKIEISKNISDKDDQKPDEGVVNSASKQKENIKNSVDVKGLKNKIKKKDTEIKHLKMEIGELKAEYLRQLADKENLRKRLEREKTEYYQSALSDILIEFLS